MPRSFGLDALRVGALVLVLFAHGCAFWFPRFTNLLAFPARIFSFVGIEVFFVLSGFLIGKALLDINETRTGVLTFWKRRAFRTLPAYYLFLLINFAVMGWLLARPIGDISYFWFGQNLYAPMQVFFFPESWSLALEEWFYLLAPLLVLLLPNWRTRAGTITAITAAILLLVFFALLRWHIAGTGASWDDGLRKVVLLRLDALVFGVVAAGIAIRCPDYFSKARLPAALLAIALFSALFVWFGENQTQQSVAFGSLSFSHCGLAAMLLVPYFAGWQHTSYAALGRWITRFSQWAYGIYLTHLVVLFLALHYAGNWATGSTWRMGVLTLVWLVSSVALAAMLYRWIEKPMTDFAANMKNVSRNTFPNKDPT